MTKALQVALIKAVIRMVAIAALLPAAAICFAPPLPDKAPVQDSTNSFQMELVEQSTIDGICWTGGEGHPYPDHVVVRDGDSVKWLGQSKVDWYISDFSRIDDSVVAFCDMR